LFEMQVIGFGGTARPESGVHVIESCCCGHAVYSGYTCPGKLFDVDQWDGSDIFMIWPLPRYIMITEEVRSFLKRGRYTGIKIRKLSEIPPTIAGTLTPGNIADYRSTELE
jgi:hypothetical protein